MAERSTYYAIVGGGRTAIPLRACAAKDIDGNRLIETLARRSDLGRNSAIAEWEAGRDDWELVEISEAKRRTD